MPSATLLEPSITERTFILQALSASSLRLDGRSPSQTRPLSITFSPDPDQVGYAHVSLGSTQAMAQVSAQLGPPRDDRPNEGLLVIQAEIDPIAGQEYEFGPGRQSDEEIVFEQRLDKAIKRTECVDREALCVIAGKKVWTVRISVHILADTGSILDCAVLACLTALRHFRKPETAIIDADTVHVFPLSERVGTPLAMAHHPACVSFSLFDLGSAESKAAMDAMKGITVASAAAAAAAAAASGKRVKGEDQEDPEMDDEDGDQGQTDVFASSEAGPGSSSYPAASTRIVCLADPTTIEEQLASSSLVFVLNAQREICMLDKAGGQPLPPEVLLAALKQAVTLVTEWTTAVDEALRRDAESRVQGVY